jgi:hypothetical protein
MITFNALTHNFTFSPMKPFLLLLALFTCSLTKADVTYYTIMGGTFTANIWSTTSAAGPSCGCSPDNTCDITIPPNTIIIISNVVTTSCNITIGNNATIIIASGGNLTVTGNASISGTGDFQINAGGSATVTGDFNVTGTGDATINGTLHVDGNVNLTAGAGSNICGGGVITVGGTVTGSPDPCFTGALPIELVEFNAVLHQTRVDVTWVTASEINNNYFTVERSGEGNAWENIALVEGAGTSNQYISYANCDYTPLSGTSYYRLKQTDYDGNSSYSQIAVVNNNSVSDAAVTLFPNPADGNNVNLRFTGFGNEEVMLVVRDMQGREYYSRNYSVKNNSETVVIPFENRLAAGMYLVVASSTNKVVTSKITVK